ncbi:MAG TPA: hypothetical protein VNU71_14635 [Burkholderiaceae bacterium]|nr:hypothetical protein [Burkholderiaceae bacterium]
MAGMGYSLETHSGTSAAATATTAQNNSGWNVNFGSGTQTSSAGQAVPTWVLVAAGVGAVLWMLKRKH